MPISHKSIIHKPIDYVAPVDLNLLGKVLQFKQNQYDQGVAKVQGQLDSVAALDVVRGQDRDYLNTRLNSLVESVNTLGGTDLSDPNISNQIAGLSSQIYGDENVINAVAGTRAFRYVQDYYKKLKEKTGTKGGQAYNPANEAYDFGKFNEWFSDERAGSPLSGGAGKVTPYTEYEKDMAKIMDNLHKNANITTQITPDGLKYVINNTEYVSPERVTNIAQKMLTPAQRQQIAIEGRYQYAGVDSASLNKSYDASRYAEQKQSEQELQDYKDKSKVATTIKDKEAYADLIKRKEAEVARLAAPVHLSDDQLREELYLKDKLQGWADTYSYSKSNTKLQMATDQMFTLKYNHDVTMDALNFRKDLADKGLLMTPDGNVVDDPNSTRGEKTSTTEGAGKGGVNIPIPVTNNLPADQKITYNEAKVDSMVSDLRTAMEQVKIDYANQVAVLEHDAPLTISDINKKSSNYLKVDPEIRRGIEKQFEALDALTRGEKVNFDKLDPGFRDHARKFMKLQKETEALVDFKDRAVNQVMEEYSITPLDIKRIDAVNTLQRKLNNIEASYKYIYGSSNEEGRRLEDEASSLKSKIASYSVIGNPRLEKYMAEYKDKLDTTLAYADKAYQLRSVTIKDTKDKDYAKALASNVVAGGLKAYDVDGSEMDIDQIDFNKLEPVTKGYRNIKGVTQAVVTFARETGSGEHKKSDFISIPLQPDQLPYLGFGAGGIEPGGGYDAGLLLNGVVKGLTTLAGVHDYEIKYDLKKANALDDNDPSVFIRVYNKNGTGLLLKGFSFPNYQAAMQTMDMLAADPNLKTLDDAIEAASKYANTK